MIEICLKIWNKLRIFFFQNFYTSYALRKSDERQGSCKMCGSCCPENCPYLKNNKCETYENRPRWCNKDFPFDEFDQKSTGVQEVCGYSWKNKKQLSKNENE